MTAKVHRKRGKNTRINTRIVQECYYKRRLLVVTGRYSSSASAAAAVRPTVCRRCAVPGCLEVVLCRGDGGVMLSYRRVADKVVPSGGFCVRMLGAFVLGVEEVLYLLHDAVCE